MVQNIYTSQFATKAEINSQIAQTSQSIDLSVNQKLTNYSTTTQMNSAINLKAGEITSSVNETFETKESANTKYSQIQQTTDNISIEVGKKVGNNEVIAKINASPEAVGINANKIELSATDVLNLLAGNTINLSSKNITIKSDVLTIDEKGNLTLKDKGTRVFKVENEDNNRQRVYITDNGVVVDSATDNDRASIGLLGNNDGVVSVTSSGGQNTEILGTGVTTPTLTQTSLERIKKNIEESNINAIEIIKNAKIYTYNLKEEEDTDKKHIGFVIGEKYNTPEEVIAKTKDGIDTYTMSSIMWKALQETAKENEELKQRIEKLEVKQ